MNIRRIAYRVLRTANDANAIKRGKVGSRAARRIYGKATGRAARKLFG